jgi:hypothetical protein
LRNGGRYWVELKEVDEFLGSIKIVEKRRLLKGEKIGRRVER